MCWVAAIPLAIAAVGAVSSSQAAGQQAAAQQQAESYQAQTQENNATIANWDARDAITQGQQKAQQAMQNAASLEGTQRATLAANGVDLTQGSAANILASTKYQSQVDVNTIQANAARTAWGYANQASNAQSNAAMLRYGASQIDPSQAATTSLLGGAGKVASSWYGAKSAGAFS